MCDGELGEGKTPVDSGETEVVTDVGAALSYVKTKVCYIETILEGASSCKATDIMLGWTKTVVSSLYYF